MANLNRVLLLGNCTRDPELKYLPTGTALCVFSLAINRKWANQDGEQKEETCFVDIKAFGKRAETITDYVKKGDPLFIEGRLSFEQWENKDGEKRSALRVICESFQFLKFNNRNKGEKNE